jgi:hypothetical protein
VQAEIDVRLQFLASEKRGEQQDGTSATVAWTAYCRLVVCTNEFLYVD